MSSNYRGNQGSTFINDKDGNDVHVTNNALDVHVTGGDIIIDNPTIVVDITAFGSTPDSVLSVGSNDGTITGTRKVIKVDSTGVQEVNGTITANIGTSGALALNATLTDKSQFTRITDGLDMALVSAAGELNVLATAQPGIDIGDVTINNAAGVAAVNIQDGGNSITVDGTVTALQGTSPWVISGTVAATQSGTWNINDISGVISLPTGAATDVTLTNKNQFTKLTDGTDTALITAAGEQNVLATAQPGIDIGDVTINNASGASAVNIQDGGNSITVDGTVNAVPLDGTKATYSAAIVGLAAANLATDIFTITGSASKTVRVLRLEISAVSTAASIRDIILLKRSAADTGGTSSTLTNVPHSSASAAATAVVRGYTVNPTVGALIGNIRTKKVDIDVATKSGPTDPIIWDFGIRPGQAIVLSGTSEVLAINLNGITVAGNNFDISVEWTEE